MRAPRLHEITTATSTYSVARAGEADVADIAALLRDDEIGAGRESSDLEPYLRAFREIDADPQQLLVIVRGEGGEAAGTVQLTFVPGLSREGAKRLIIEGVRVHSSTRGTGLGARLIEWAHEEGRARGAVLAQLTSDRRRTDAHRFYEGLGYTASHVGFKLPL